jgi:putative DNA primase/helicase
MAATDGNVMLNAALAYAARGLAVHPLEPFGKKPFTKHGFKDATTAVEQITRWWTDTPDANIGIATGAVSQISVLDVDIKEWEGKHGDDTLRALTAQHGALPPTLVQVTWSGGMQIIFAYTPKAAQGVNCYGPDLDGRNDGGYIVAPPSHVIDEAREGVYQWLGDPAITALAPMPQWLLDRIVKGGTKSAKPPRDAAIKELRNGKARNTNLTSIGGALRRKGAEPDEIEAALSAINRTSGADLPETEVQSIAKSLGNYEPSETTTEPGGERFTDMRNAGRLAGIVKERVGHAEEMKDRWYIFREVRLTLENRSGMVPFVGALAQTLFVEADRITASAMGAMSAMPNSAELEGLSVKELQRKTDDAHDPRLASVIEQLLRAQEMKDAATRLESMAGCYATIEMAKAEPSLRLKMEQLDAHPTWLNTPTGTLDLDTGEVHAHRFADYLTKLTGASYDPTATCPRWDAFLEQMLPDPEVRAFMQRAIGYSLTDLTTAQCLFFLYGKGRNGKTTVINAVRRMLGDYAAATKASTLMVKQHGDDKRNDVAVLRGARFVSATEAEDGQQVAESLVKELTGQDPITARLMYAEFFTFTPTFKIFLAANHKPLVRGTDLAIWRRIHLVPFTQTVPLDQVDATLPDHLAAEQNGILNWAIAGYRDYRDGGLRPPKAVTDATEEYRAEMDPLADFLAEACFVGPSVQGRASELYSAYQRWAQAHGIKFPWTAKRLGLQLQDRGFESVRDTTGDYRMWRGVKAKLT